MDAVGGTSLSLAITLVGLLFIMVWKAFRHKGNLPPGPTPFPFLGNLLQVRGKDTVQTIIKLSEKYGPVFTLHFGSRPVLVLCGHESVKEALVDQADDFSGRGDFPIFEMITKGYGVVISNGERWKQLRRFSIMTLRNFGMGKRSIEERIQEEAQFLVEELKKTNELPFDPTYFFSKAVSNVICSIVFGNRFDYEDKKFLALLQLFNSNFRFLSSSWGQILNQFPAIRFLPGPHNAFFREVKMLKRFVKEDIKEHQETLDPSNPRDYIDCFLIKMMQDTENQMSEFSRKNLVGTTINLFVAGTETVSTTLRYGLMVLLKNQGIEEKMHQEIDSVIGQNRQPCIDDRSKMPYTDAVIHEIQRFIDIIPMNLPHCVTRDTRFRGYTIPKGMTVIPVLTSVLHDQKKYGNPECFDPKHFLDENGGFKKNDAFVPFSTGKRICLGEGLARMELFLFFTTILQNFSLKAVGNPDDIDLTPEISGFSHIPRLYQLCLVPRLI
ncbi:cytochrome P450 2G1-like [Ambystoma mexicanum]|uniref:cytochrome P450 2G1-like n=1 Tax=Ambystoma mexicanum TaxID=8296 RepID=UPI0037E7F8C4